VGSDGRAQQRKEAQGKLRRERNMQEQRNDFSSHCRLYDRVQASKTGGGGASRTEKDQRDPGQSLGVVGDVRPDRQSVETSV
jgi:hypothetical protein